MYEHLGQTWSILPPHNRRGGFNVRSGIEVVSYGILALALTRKGENLMHPEFGVAPDLFEPTTGLDVTYIVANLKKQILKWVPGIRHVDVAISGHNVSENQLRVEVKFVPSDSNDLNILVFPYYQYQGLMLGRVPLDSFLSGVTLDNTQLFTQPLA